MESNLITEFVAETGLDSALAYNFLQAKGWDLNLALQTYAQYKLSYGNECTDVGVIGKKSHSSQWSTPVTEENGNVSFNQYSISRRTLPKYGTIDVSENKKLTRGISRATENVNLVSRARSDIELHFKEKALCSVNQYFIQTPVYTFTLPDLTIYPEDFRKFLEKDLIEVSSLISLEQSGRLNWWTDSGACQRLWPLATTGDGNCLLHAASLGMWGFHDRLLTLRRALYGFMTGSECKDALWRRWRWQQTRLNTEAGFVYTEEEWRKEWDSIVSMASTEPRKQKTGRRRSMVFDRNPDEVPANATYESLEEIHVLALAHVLRRPIIVIADLMLKDVNGDDLAPIPFGGIYLPMECPSSDCHRSPLVLTYDAAHFSALVIMEKEVYADKIPQPPAMIPLTDFEHELLPIQFSVDPGEQFIWGKDEINSQLISKFTLAKKDKLELLHKYLDVATVPLLSTPNSEENGDFVEIEADPLMVMNNDEDEIDKKFAEIEADATDETSLADNNMFSTNRSKAAKQLQSVAKQFGSIGKSMSKKLKKNLGSITKITRNHSEKKDNGAGIYIPSSPIRQKTKLNPNIIYKTQDYILCGVLHTEKRHEYQEEMIHNYLLSARERFQHDKELKMKQAEESKLREELKLKDIAQIEGASQCINPDCNQLGTALTSYMCKDCFERQRDRELIKINSPSLSRAVDNVENYAPKYGIGKSYFYTESDLNSHNTISRLPSTRVGSNIDQTLYLSKSTFYNDFNPFFVTDNKGESVREHDSSRNMSQELVVKPGTYIHELSPTITKPDHISNFQNYNWQEDIGGTGRNVINKHNMPVLSSRFCGYSKETDNSNVPALSQDSATQRIHSYNLARSWDSSSSAGSRTSESLGRAGSQQDFSHNTLNSSDSAGQRFRSQSSTAKGSLGSSASARNVSVATLTAQSSNDLPKVERVGCDKNSQLSSSVSRSLMGAHPCWTKNCKFFGSAESDYYCSKCFKEQNNAVRSLKVQEMKR